MFRSILVLAGLLALASCDRGDETAAPGAGSEPPVPGSGQAAYESACARCHEDGKDGAPRTRHPEDWENRSSLWQSVLFEHARSGYLNMPAKGGDETLPEDVINAAAEYMLEITHSLPPD